MRRLVVLALALAPACALFRPASVPVDHPVHETGSGVTWRDELPGDGKEARPGDTLVVHYEAWLAGGEPLDSTHDRGEPVAFVLGAAPLAGWDEVLPGMRVGGSRTATLPPEAAYGAEGVEGRVPPDATLVFTFELMEVQRP